jgi:hypothetical protein
MDFHICTIYVNQNSFCNIHLSWRKTSGPIEKTINSILHHTDDNYIQYYINYFNTNETYNELTYNEIVIDLFSRLCKYPELDTITDNVNNKSVVCNNRNDILYVIKKNVMHVRNKMTQTPMSRLEKGKELFDNEIKIDDYYLPEFKDDAGDFKKMLDDTFADILRIHSYQNHKHN